jgi:hypothetical protein
MILQTTYLVALPAAYFRVLNRFFSIFHFRMLTTLILVYQSEAKLTFGNQDKSAAKKGTPKKHGLLPCLPHSVEMAFEQLFTSKVLWNWLFGCRLNIRIR